jgi:hypothetical protein
MWKKMVDIEDFLMPEDPIDHAGFSLMMPI